MNKRRRNQMRRSLLIGWTALFLAAAPAGWAVDAARLYGDKCAPCHGGDGQGTQTAPPHKGNPFITQGEPEAIKEVILKGRQGAEKKYPDIPIEMPGGLVTEKQAEALVGYMKGALQTSEEGFLRGRCAPGEHRGRHCDRRGMR